MDPSIDPVTAASADGRPSSAAAPHGAEAVPALSPDAALPVTKARRTNPVIEWFWRRDALAAARRVHARSTERARELRARGEAALALANHALRPSDPLPGAGGAATAAELFRQASYWFLEAGLEAAGSASPATSAPDLARTWAASDADWLARSAGGETALEAVRADLLVASLVDDAELEPPAQRERAQRLRAFAESLKRQLDAPRAAADRAHRQRFWRVGGLAVLVVGGWLGALYAEEAAERRNNLAFEKPWRTSSRYGATGCESPKQECPASEAFFFHTEDQDQPWIEFELDPGVRISGARVTNRLDCCLERAAPLVLEISDDHKKWKAVARRADSFDVWAPSFARTSARWVRLRLDRTGTLHLKEVRLLP